MKILAVCGMGLGSALLIKMTIERAVKALGIDATVDTADIGMARGAGVKADVIVTSAHLAERLGDVEGTIITVKNLMSEEEVTEKLRDALSGSS